MRPHRVLLLYGTNYGQTTKIATRIASHIKESGAVVTLHDVHELTGNVPLDAYDAVVIGASVIRGRHQRVVHEFVRKHYDILNRMPTAFFSVSGSAASLDERGRAEARRCAEEFLADVHWQPAMTELIGGAMAYTRYGPVLRWIMKQIAKRNHGPTDTSKDHELTDWAQVMRFSDRFVALLEPPVASTAVLSP